MLIQGVVLTIPPFLLRRSSASHVVRTDHVTISVTPVSEANAGFQMIKAYAMVVLHASVIVHTTTRTTQITQMDHLCVDDTTENHGSQMPAGCVNHKYVANHFLTSETTRDLMAKIFILTLKNLNLSMFQTVREIRTTMERQTKLSHMEARNGVVAPSPRLTRLHREAHVRRSVSNARLAGTKSASEISKFQSLHLTMQTNETSLGVQWTGRKF